NNWIVESSNGRGALDVDIDQDVYAILQIRDERFAKRPVVMLLVHFRVLQKISGFHSRQKILFGNELIIFALDFARARRARRAGNRVDEVRRLAKRVAERGLAGAGGRGDDEQNSGAGKFSTQGFGFAPGFFPIPTCKRQRAAKCRRHWISRQAYSVPGKFPG